METINNKYGVPLMTDLANVKVQKFSDAIVATDKITNLFLHSSTSPASANSGQINKRKHGVYVRLPQDVKCENDLESRKQVDFLKEGTEFNTYLANGRSSIEHGGTSAFLNMMEQFVSMGVPAHF